MTYNFMRKAGVIEKTGYKSTALWERVKDGTMPPPINLGGNVSAYLQHEIDAVLSARSIGYNDDQIKALVKSLVEQRKTAANDLLQSLKVAG